MDEATMTSWSNAYLATVILPFLYFPFPSALHLPGSSLEQCRWNLVLEREE